MRLQAHNYDLQSRQANTRICRRQAVYIFNVYIFNVCSCAIVC